MPRPWSAARRRIAQSVLSGRPRKRDARSGPAQATSVVDDLRDRSPRRPDDETGQAGYRLVPVRRRFALAMVRVTATSATDHSGQTLMLTKTLTSGNADAADVNVLVNGLEAGLVVVEDGADGERIGQRDIRCGDHEQRELFVGLLLLLTPDRDGERGRGRSRGQRPALTQPVVVLRVGRGDTQGCRAHH